MRFHILSFPVSFWVITLLPNPISLFWILKVKAVLNAVPHNPLYFYLIWRPADIDQAPDFQSPGGCLTFIQIYHHRRIRQAKTAGLKDIKKRILWLEFLGCPPKYLQHPAPQLLNKFLQYA
jgi:hypothetical protein